MKLFYEVEDSVFGIILGFLLVSPLVVRIPFYTTILQAAFAFFIILNILDVRHCVKDFRHGMGSNTLAIAMNVADIFINLAFLSKMLQVEIPFVTAQMVPLITPDTTLIVAAYFIIGNAFWILDHHRSK
ncbi:MAG: hypothetical protein HYW27_02065 [Candidatus Aenigmarchaeota archaeon]|nr:hypothetical protein [Candidatus Aenigmarchaeota archaeon]